MVRHVARRLSRGYVIFARNTLVGLHSSVFLFYRSLQSSCCTLFVSYESVCCKKTGDMCSCLYNLGCSRFYNRIYTFQILRLKQPCNFVIESLAFHCYKSSCPKPCRVISGLFPVQSTMVDTSVVPSFPSTISSTLLSYASAISAGLIA